ncbi:hypothetical protein M5K25_011004 [Dendrobium thyrsiflorum]|uniref:Uncharacterized protein n=1 Tax=Dendrobium thyrsiflorum TaxID=117978 RepID=A0ABD0V2R3_DENTH
MNFKDHRRMVLVKYAFLYLPLILLTHSLVPMGILNNFGKMCRNFIRNKQNGNQGLHYVAWDVLCKAKIGEAMDFIQQLQKVIWNAKIKSGSSVTWEIIINGAKSLRPIVRWNVSIEYSINILKDVWIPDRSIDKWPKWQWNVDQLEKCFGTQLIDLIQQVELKTNESTKYNIALVYEASIEDYPEDNYWSWIKKLRLRPQVQIFLWHLFNNAIPSNDFLQYRRLLGHNVFPIGCLSVEDANHIAANYSKLIQGFQVPIFSSLAYYSKNLRRNKGKYGGVEDSFVFIAANVISFVSLSSLFLSIQKNWGVNQLSQLFSNFWHPPPLERLKALLECSEIIKEDSYLNLVSFAYLGYSLVGADGHPFLEEGCTRLDIISKRSYRTIHDRPGRYVHIGPSRVRSKFRTESSGRLVSGFELIVQDDVVSYRTILSNAWVRYNDRLDEQCLPRFSAFTGCGEKGSCGSLPGEGRLLRFSAGRRKIVAVLCRRKEEGSLPSLRSGEKGSVAVLCRRKEEGFSAITV